MSMAPNYIEAKNTVSTHYQPPIASNSDLAAQYGQMLIKSLITLNTGLAIAFPTVSEIFTPTLPFESILLPTFLALLGAVLAIFGGYATYFNYNAHATMYNAAMQIDFLNVDEKFDDKTYHQMRTFRDQNRNSLEDDYKKSKSRINTTYLLGNFLGVAALILFVSSVGVFAYRMA